MLARYVEVADQGRPVFVTDLRSALTDRATSWIDAVLVLPDGRSTRTFRMPRPDLDPANEPEIDLFARYVRAEIYNHLCTLGGYSLTLVFDTSDDLLASIVDRVVADFQIDRARADRTAYARIVNMLDRMNDALHPDEPAATRAFSIGLVDSTDAPPPPANVSFSADATDTVKAVTGNLEGSIVCGLDIGGTDIKGALAVDGRLVALKEYDWNPAACGEVERVIDPIVTIARLLRARAAFEAGENTPHDDSAPAARAAVEAALAPDADVATMENAAEVAEAALGGGLRPFDAIGLCFPDVVVRNRIVGGEVPKTQAMRRNRARDFEEQFARLSSLDSELGRLCRAGGVVMNTNDGPMAAFTAAVEIAASPTPELGRAGVFAHTLGTDLGSGLALANGSIPEIPLELYNLVLDLGSTPARALPPEDLRSLANTNTGIPGTPQKLASQAAAFRIADELLGAARRNLLESFESEGYVVVAEDGSKRVPEEPIDRRKPFLAHLMSLAESDDDVAEVFRTIGEHLAVVYRESEHILSTGLRQRFLFGRFVKSARCFELMQEGARRRENELELVAADSDMAYTPLMRALDADPHYTVAQFGQAIGAIYFGNLGLVAGA